MSTVKATNFQHPSSAAANITLGSDGSVVLPAGFSGGLGTNVVQTVKTDSFSTTSSSLTDVTGLAVTITPTSATSKVLVLVDLMIGSSGGGRTNFQLVRDSTEIGKSSGGLSDSTLTVVTSSDSGAFSFLDSPATTSATTYKVQMLADNQTGYVNRIAASDRRSISTITAIEVAA